MKRLWPSIKQLPPWCLEKEMAIHSSILAREIPWTGEAGGLSSMGSQRVRHNCAHMPHGDICEHGAIWVPQFSSVQLLSCVSLWPHGLHHARLPCPSPTPRACSNSCPLSQWCHPTISSSVVPFSSCPESFPASGSFPMSQFFASGDHSIGISASASVLQVNIQDWFPLGWTGLISLQSKGLSGVFSNTTVQKHQFFSAQLSL